MDSEILTTWQRDIESRVEALENGQAIMQRSLDENTRLTREVRDNTIDIVHALGGLRVFGHVAKWLGGVAAAAAAVWTLIKGWR